MTDQQKNRSIVVATDLAEDGAVALQEAYGMWGRAHDIDLHIVYALTRPNEDLEELGRQLDRRLARLRSHVIPVLREMKLNADGRPRPMGHVRIGKPAEVICQVAVDFDADLIIVGTRARKGIERLILGSVSADVLSRARTPVLVARPKDYTGLRVTDSVQPPRPDQDMSAPAVNSGVHIASVDRGSHISGLL